MRLRCHLCLCSHCQTSGCVFCWLLFLKLRAIFKRSTVLNCLQVCGYAILKTVCQKFQWTFLYLEENSIVFYIYQLHTWEVVRTARLLKCVTIIKPLRCPLPKAGLKQIFFFRLPQFLIKARSLVIFFLSETAIFIFFTGAIIYLNNCYHFLKAQPLPVVCKAEVFSQRYEARSDVLACVRTSPRRALSQQSPVPGTDLSAFPAAHVQLHSLPTAGAAPAPSVRQPPAVNVLWQGPEKGTLQLKALAPRTSHCRVFVSLADVKWPHGQRAIWCLCLERCRVTQPQVSCD